MANHNYESLTHIFESTIEGLSKGCSGSIHWFTLDKNEANLSSVFIGVETEIYRLKDKSESIKTFMQQLELSSTTEAANLLMAYLVLTRPAYINAPTYEWKETYTCRHKFEIPLYFVNGSSPLQLAHDDKNGCSTNQSDRFREFDNKCFEFSLILGMSKKHRGNGI